MKMPTHAAVPSSSPTRMRPRRALAALAVACLLPALAGCPWRGGASSGTSPIAPGPSPLAWSVDRAQLTHRLPTDSLESRDAAPGNQFVVLDVRVRNRDAGPQVLAEGALIAIDESKLQTFDRPVTVLSDDDYLSLQVLKPAQQLHGRIAYEVPEPLRGVLYWSPGNGSERILLNPVGAAPAISTLADATGAEVEPSVAAAAIEPQRARVPSTARAAVASDATANATPVARVEPVPPAPRVREPSPPRSTAIQATALRAASTEESPTTIVLPSAPSAPSAPPAAAVTGAAPERPSNMTPVPPPVDADRARRLACSGLVERDDPAEKQTSLGFFAESCRDYALPPRWRPRPAHRSLIERAGDLLARVVVRPRVVRISDCSSAATSHADRLVCGDPRLSAMDHRLAQSVARASDQVDDPAALQREQDQWRGRVRNACQTAGCLAQAYGRRIAQVEAIAPLRP